jgi:hypothetical protein
MAINNELLAKVRDHILEEPRRYDQGNQAYVNELRTLNLRDLAFELEGMKKWQLQELAAVLNLPVRYDDNSLKPKDVLVAAIYEEFRVEARRQERDAVLTNVTPKAERVGHFRI